MMGCILPEDDDTGFGVDEAEEGERLFADVVRPLNVPSEDARRQDGDGTKRLEINISLIFLKK